MSPGRGGSRSAGSPERRSSAGARCAAGVRVADGAGEALEDHRKAEPARIDDVGVAEHLELIRGALDCGVGLGDHTVEDDPDVVGGRSGGRGGRGRVADDGEDGALGRLHHGPIRHRRSLGDGQRHPVGVEVGTLGRPLGKAAEDLREDDAAVAARPHERAVRRRREHRVRRLGHRGVAGLLHRRAQRQVHVRTCVAVGDREYVEVVDLLLVRLQPRERGGEPGEDLLAADLAQRFAEHRQLRRGPSGGHRHSPHGCPGRSRSLRPRGAPGSSPPSSSRHS